MTRKDTPKLESIETSKLDQVVGGLFGRGLFPNLGARWAQGGAGGAGGGGAGGCAGGGCAGGSCGG